MTALSPGTKRRQQHRGGDGDGGSSWAPRGQAGAGAGWPAGDDLARDEAEYAREVVRLRRLGTICPRDEILPFSALFEGEPHDEPIVVIAHEGTLALLD